MTAQEQQFVCIADIPELIELRSKCEELEKHNKEIKELARDGKIKGEVARHKSPQVKRAMGYLMDYKFKLEDANDILSSLSKVPVVEANESIYMGKLEKLAGIVEHLTDSVESEIQANKIASRSSFGWKTVKMFESDSLFQGEEADSLTKKLRSAEYQAGRDSKFKNSFRKTRWDKKPSDSRTSESRSSDSRNSDSRVVKKPFDMSKIVCFRCSETGHFQNNCPKKN